jgi:predicted nucleic acid-binding protein
MSDRYFLDTNIIVYTFDSASPVKQERAKALVRAALEGAGRISWQVIQEFCNAAIRKFRKPMSSDDLRRYQDGVLFPLCTVWPDETLYREALAAGLETGYGWYDSLIVVSALRSECRTLYSEDLQHDRKFRGLKIINPFKN